MRFFHFGKKKKNGKKNQGEEPPRRHLPADRPVGGPATGRHVPTITTTILFIYIVFCKNRRGISFYDKIVSERLNESVSAYRIRWRYNNYGRTTTVFPAVFSGFGDVVVIHSGHNIIRLPEMSDSIVTRRNTTFFNGSLFFSGPPVFRRYSDGGGKRETRGAPRN